MSFEIIRLTENDDINRQTAERIVAAIERLKPKWTAKEFGNALTNGGVAVAGSDDDGSIHTLGLMTHGWNWVYQTHTASLQVAVGQDVDGLVRYTRMAAGILGGKRLFVDPEISFDKTGLTCSTVHVTELST